MVGSYDTWLVVLSIVVAVIASYVALDLAARVAASAGSKVTNFWLVGGAVSMGTGIWSMHFIGMLAFELPIPMSYDIPITLVSLLIAGLVSGFALYTVSHGALSARRLLSAGLVMGIGIASMHFTGMAAMQMEPPIAYDPLLFILSIVIAIAASVAALWIAFQLRLETILSAFWKKAGSALVMGAAISGMHYTGMAAANFAPNSVCVVSPQDINNAWLAGSIGGFTFMLLAATLLISVFDLRAYDESIEKTKAQKGLLQVNKELDAMVGELTAANAELEAFAYTIAHDLRAPLRHITGFAESLRKHSGHSLDAEGSRLLNIIHNSAAKQTKLINNLLIYAKTGQHTLKIETVQLSPLVQEIRHELSLALGPSDATEWRTASLPGVIGDTVLLQQVFYNLLSNAVKFTRKTERPIIEIGVQPGEVGRVITFVRDNGAGFDMRYAGNLFGVFKRLHNSKEFEGTGIGLAHVRRIVQRLGGRVWAEGKVNEGASLYVDLPRGENQA